MKSRFTNPNSKDKHSTRVRFMYNERESDLYAVFPDTVQAKDIHGNMWYMIYAECGQHSCAHVEYMTESREATPDEYSDLAKELRSIGYNLHILNA